MGKIRNVIIKIPVLGRLLWWVYMIFLSPQKITELSGEIKKLSTKIKTLESAERTTTGEPSSGHTWADFYNRQVDDEFMQTNVKCHKDFIDAIITRANSIAENRIPRLLEIGVGTATMSIYFSKGLSMDVTGLDDDPIVITQAVETNTKLGGHAKFIRMNAYDIPTYLKEKSFDIAFSQGTMEHFNNEEIRQLLQAQLYAARTVIFSVPSVNYPRQDYGNERLMSKEAWRKLLTSMGFNIELVEYYWDKTQIICIIGDK